MRKVQKHHITLNSREITGFLHNAQLGSLERVSEEVLPALFEYKTLLVHALYEESKFTPAELICVLTSAAWDLWQKDKQNENPTVGR